MNQSPIAVRLVLACTLLGAAAVAQGGRCGTISLPSAGYAPATVGDYTGGCRQDAILIHDHQAWMAFSPANHSTVTSMDANWYVNDVATMKAAGTIRRDRLVGVGSAGLTLGLYDEQGVFSYSVLDTGNWVGALQVECSGTTDAALIVGVAADHTRVGVAAFANGSFSGSTWSNLGSTVLQVVPFDWNHDGTPEIGVLTTSELRVLSATLGRIVMFPGGGGAITCLHQDGGADELAWVRAAGGGSHELTLVSPLGLSTPLHLTLPLATGTTDVFPLVGIAGGDANDDGRDDLAIAQNATSEVVVLYRQIGSTPFLLPPAPQPTVLKVAPYHEPQTAAGTLAAVPLFTDCGCNRRADVVAVSGNSLMIVFDEAPSTAPVLDHSFKILEGHGYPGELKVRFHLPNPAPSQGYIQAIVWYEQAELNGYIPMPSGLPAQAYAPDPNTSHKLVDGGPAGATWEFTLRLIGDRDSWGVNSDIWAFQVEEQMVQAHLFIELRFVDIVDGHVISSSPSACCGVTGNNSDVELQYGDDPESIDPSLQFLSRLIDSDDVSIDPDHPPRTLRGRQRLVGGIVPLTNLPKTSDDGFDPDLPLPGTAVNQVPEGG